MDPISQRMIGLRADMTPQIARIATTRLKDAPRPLRLFYAGQVLRVRGGEIRAERQVGQVGAELIGSDAVAADIEVAAVAAEALTALGIAGLSVDLTLPTLVPALCRALGLDVEALATSARAARSQGCGGDGGARRCRCCGARPPSHGVGLGAASTGGAGTARSAGRGGDGAHAAGGRCGGARAAHAPALAHGRSGRESRLRVPYRHQLRLLRPRPWRRAGPRRALSHRRCRRARDRLHALYRHAVAGGAGAGRRPPALSALRRSAPKRAVAGAARAGSRWRRSVPSPMPRAEARRLGCSHFLAGDKIMAVA